MSTIPDAIGPEELDGLFARFFPAAAPAGVALAVSGGSDSTALMVLFADWLRAVGASASGITVLTVDHALRPESVTEAAAVARHAHALGFRHTTLQWNAAKPATGLQAAARAARYQLIAQYARAHAITLLLTAHTADDQAETLLMRLARGSGLDGLSAMRDLTRLGIEPDALSIARPLLGVAKARLQASLRSRGIAWCEDPSNLSPSFERVRLRAAQPHLQALGLTNDKLATSAQRLQRARAALESWVAEFCDPARGNLHIDPSGFVRIDGEAWRRLPSEVALRVLTAAVTAAGGSGAPLPLAKLEAIAGELAAGPLPRTWTLARAKISATPEAIALEREPGRAPLPKFMLGPGEEALWDGRFHVRAGPGLQHPVEVGALAAEGLADVRRHHSIPGGLPAGVLRSVPCFRRLGVILSVPSLGIRGGEDDTGQLAAMFLGLHAAQSGVMPLARLAVAGAADEDEFSA